MYRYVLIFKSHNEPVTLQVNNDVTKELESAWQAGKNLTFTTDDYQMMIRMSEVILIKCSKV